MDPSLGPAPKTVGFGWQGQQAELVQYFECAVR
jgi:hypothetical protein